MYWQTDSFKIHESQLQLWAIWIWVLALCFWCFVSLCLPSVISDTGLYTQDQICTWPVCFLITILTAVSTSDFSVPNTAAEYYLSFFFFFFSSQVNIITSAYTCLHSWKGESGELVIHVQPTLDILASVIHCYLYYSCVLKDFI